MGNEGSATDDSFSAGLLEGPSYTRPPSYEGRDVPNVRELVHEMKEFRARQSVNGNLSFNAREGQHDDLVLALCYAVFGALRPRPVTDLDVRFAA